jgi:hypothetical protein
MGGDLLSKHLVVGPHWKETVMSANAGLAKKHDKNNAVGSLISSSKAIVDNTEDLSPATQKSRRAPQSRGPGLQSGPA